MKRIFIFLIFIWLSTQLLDIQAQYPQDNPVPYLYYYSNFYNAIVVEHADGTDAHLVGAGLAPEQTNDALSVGWSASGRWLAWIPRYLGVPTYNEIYAPIIVDTFSNKPAIEFEPSLSATYIEWSPTDDWLLMTVSEGSPNTEEYLVNARLSLFNPATGRSVAQADCCFDPYSPYMMKITWDESGVYIIASRNQVIYLGKDGTSKEWHFNGVILGDISRDHDVVYAGIENEKLFLSVVNLRTNRNFQVTDEILQNRDLDTFDDFEFRWHAQGIGLTDGEHLWQLDLISQMLEHIEADPPIEHVSGYRNAAFSPSGQQVLYTNENGELYLLDLQTRQSYFLAEEFWNTWWEDDLLYFSDLSSDNLLSDLKYPLLNIYDLVNHRLWYSTILPDAMSGILVQDTGALSPDKTLLAINGEGTYIYNLRESSLKRFQPSLSKYWVGAALGEINWHSQGEWLITTELNYAQTGGVYWRSKVGGIIHAVSRFQRPLRTANVFQQAEWLPESVDSSDLPPLDLPEMREPLQVLTGDDRYQGIFSWSPDGRYLAVGLGKLGRGERFYEDYWFGVWRLVDEVVVQVLHQSGEVQLVWEQDVHGNYQAKTVSVERRKDVLESALALLPDGNGWLDIVRDLEHGTVLGLRPLHSWDVQVAYYTDAYFVAYTYSKDGKWLAGVSPGMGMYLWDANSGGCPIGKIPIHGHGLEFSPDGSRLAVGATWDVQIWAVEDALAMVQPVECNPEDYQNWE